MLVEDSEVVEATNLLWKFLKVIVEPTSATVLAAIIKYKEMFKNKNVAAVITGGNIDV